MRGRHRSIDRSAGNRSGCTRASRNALECRARPWRRRPGSDEWSAASRAPSPVRRAQRAASAGPWAPDIVCIVQSLHAGVIPCSYRRKHAELSSFLGSSRGSSGLARHPPPHNRPRIATGRLDSTVQESSAVLVGRKSRRCSSSTTETCWAAISTPREERRRAQPQFHPGCQKGHAARVIPSRVA